MFAYGAQRLFGMLPDKVRDMTATLMPTQAAVDAPVVSASFVNLKKSLGVVVCTRGGMEIWKFVDHQLARRAFFLPEPGARTARYIPPSSPNQPQTATSAERHLNLVQANAPILAVAKPAEAHSTSLEIHLYSLKSHKYIHAIKPGKELLDFIVNSQVIAVLMKGGEIRLFDLKSLEQISTIQTVFLSRKMQELVERGEGSVSGMVREAIPVCDLSSHLIAYARHDIASESKFEEIAKSIMGTRLIQDYSLAKNATQRLFSFGEYSYTKVMNLFNARAAAAISEDTTQELLPSVYQSHPTKAEPEDEEFVNITEDIAGEDVKNRVSVTIEQTGSGGRIANVVLPFFHGISCIKFSPSGRLLVVGNENGQYFYLYRLFPETNMRHDPSRTAAPAYRKVMLLYSIFRGYSAAQVSSVSFSLCEKWLIISSAKGTSHIYRLDENIKFLKDSVFLNGSRFNYDLVESRIIDLSAFSRFKYSTSLGNTELSPITTVVSHYPLRLLGAKKEALMRTGATFLHTAVGAESNVPLFLALTNLGEVYANALLIFQSAGGKGAEGESEYQLLKDQKLPSTGNYYNDKLVVENIAKFEMRLDAGSSKKPELTAKDVKRGPGEKEGGAPKSKKEEEDEEDEEEKKDATAEAVPTATETATANQKMWLKEIVMNPRASSTPSIKILPQFAFCRWTEAEPKVEKLDPVIHEDALYEKFLSREAAYQAHSQAGEPDPFASVAVTVAEGRHKGVVLTVELEVEPELESEGKEEEKEKGRGNSNPFYGTAADKEFERKLAEALNTSISTTKFEDQKSQIFGDSIKIMDQYSPSKQFPDSDIDQSEFS